MYRMVYGFLRGTTVEYVICHASTSGGIARGGSKPHYKETNVFFKRLGRGNQDVCAGSTPIPHVSHPPCLIPPSPAPAFPPTYIICPSTRLLQLLWQPSGSAQSTVCNSHKAATAAITLVEPNTIEL